MVKSKKFWENANYKNEIAGGYNDNQQNDRQKPRNTFLFVGALNKLSLYVFFFLPLFFVTFFFLNGNMKCIITIERIK